MAQSQVDLSSSVRFSATNKRKYQRRIREQELLRVNPRHSSPASKTMPLASDCRRGNEDPGLGAAALINTPPLSSDCLGICHHTIPQPQSQHELQQTKKSFRNRTQQPGENLEASSRASSRASSTEPTCRVNPVRNTGGRRWNIDPSNWIKTPISTTSDAHTQTHTIELISVHFQHVYFRIFTGLFRISRDFSGSTQHVHAPSSFLRLKIQERVGVDNHSINHQIIKLNCLL